MHYKTPSLGFGIAPVDEFIKGRGNARKLGKSEIDPATDALPEKTEVWVLDMANR
jgi:hypothetical protein